MLASVATTGNSLFITTMGDSLFLSKRGRSLFLGASMGVSNAIAFVATCGNTTMALDISFCASKGKSLLLSSFDLAKCTVVGNCSTDKVGASGINPFVVHSRTGSHPCQEFHLMSQTANVLPTLHAGCRQVMSVP